MSNDERGRDGTRSSRFVRERWLLVACFGLALLIYFPELSEFSLSIDEELHGAASAQELARAWSQQGRWGMGLLSLVVPPMQALPFLPTLLFCAGLVVSGLWASAIVATSAAESLFFAATFISCPVWLHIAEFNTLSWGFAVGLVATTAAAMACRRAAPRTALGASLLLAFAIGVYQTLVLAYVVLVIMAVAAAALRRDDDRIPDVSPRGVAVRGIAVLVAGLLIYAVVARSILWGMGSELSYVGTYDNLPEFFGPGAVRAMLRVAAVAGGFAVGLHPAFLGWGAAVLAPVWLGLVGRMTLLMRDSRDGQSATAPSRTALGVALALLACGVAMSPVVVSAGRIPTRALVALPLLAAWASVGVLRAPRPLPTLGWGVLGYSAFVCAWLAATLFNSDQLARQRDLVLATRLAVRIQDVAAAAADQPIRLATIGSWDHDHALPGRTSEIFGTSFFEHNGGEIYRIQMYLRSLGIRNVVAVRVHEIAPHLDAIATMPSWPARDSVQVLGDTVVVKFGPLSYQQQMAIDRWRATQQDH